MVTVEFFCIVLVSNTSPVHLIGWWNFNKACSNYNVITIETEWFLPLSTSWCLLYSLSGKTWWPPCLLSTVCIPFEFKVLKSLYIDCDLQVGFLRRYGYRLEEIHIKWTWKLFDIRRAAEEGVLFSPVNDSTLAWWLSWRKEGLNAPKILNFELQISEVRSLIEPIPDRLSVYCSNQTISRYLIARNWNVKKATKMLKDSLKWRLEYKPDEIRWVTFPLQTIYINLHIQVI